VLTRLWNLLCSLKLTIWLASLATVLTMGGSIVMIKFPKTFGDIDTMVLSTWFARFGAPHPGKSWWLYLVCLLIVLLALNTLCCFLDWLPKIRSRWRKSGEYLIHLGFVLAVIAFTWGGISGQRQEGLALAVGDTLDLGAIRPGYTLRLDRFTPDFGPEGRPNDMRSDLTLLRDGKPLRRETIRINHPLTDGDLVILPASFDQTASGFRCVTAQGEELELRPGSRLRLSDGGWLRVVNFWPDVVQEATGKVFPRGRNLDNPAFELELLAPGHEPWRGWYLLRQGVPEPLRTAGLSLRPTEPLITWVSILTINRDPGAGIALVSAYCFGGGVLLALASFYYKRQRGDRPDIL